MIRTSLLAALVLAAACGKDKPASDQPPKPAPKPAVALDAAAAGGGGAAVAPPAKAKARPAAKPAPVTREARATYRKQLDAGRKLARATKWPEAIAAFEAALVAVPGDDRALSELSFAAMNAGDALKARDAGRRAVLAATEAKVKAAALYNLGRVEEPTQPSAAAALYRQSLALRPNKTVEKRLADLGKALPATAAPEALPCTAPVTRDALCQCLGETSELPPEERQCELTDTKVDGVAYATYALSGIGEQAVMIVAGAGDRWQVVGRLGTIYNPGAFGISEEWSLTDVSEREVGGHRVIELRTTTSRNDSDLGINEVESEEREDVVVCVRAAAGALPTCPLAATLRTSYERDVLMDDLSPEEQAELARYRAAGLPIRSATKVSLEIGADGVAHLRAVEGRVDGAQLGDRKLW